jgi:pyruvate dehydrogenase E1 component alpha subunit
MHFFDAEVGNHGGHGIVGGHIPLGLGFAFAQGYKKSGGVTFCLFGDGAVNQGTFHEAFNMATLLKAPVIFIVENNGVAMGTQVERHSATKDLAERGSGYNMPHRNIDGNDVDTVIKEMTIAADRARKMEGPTFLVANTYRFRGHSMSDPLKYRTKEEAEKARLRDPIRLYAKHLHERGSINDELYEALKVELPDWSGPMLSEVAEEVEQAIQQAEADPNPPLEDRFNDALAEEYPYQPK